MDYYYWHSWKGSIYHALVSLLKLHLSAGFFLNKRYLHNFIGLFLYFCLFEVETNRHDCVQCESYWSTESCDDSPYCVHVVNLYRYTQEVNLYRLTSQVYHSVYGLS